MLKIGHRGASGYAPENTIKSFLLAVEQGADMIELDVHITKDGELIVMHDRSLNRTTNGQGLIRKKTLSEIKNYRTKDGNLEIPTLKEAVNAVIGKAIVNAEIKGIRPARATAKLIKDNGWENDVIVSSNYITSLKIAKSIAPGIKTALIYYSAQTYFGLMVFVVFSLIIFPITKFIIMRRANKSNADYLHPNYMLVSRRLVSMLHKKGYSVHPWTVNNKLMIKRMARCGVDGIMTNYPDRIK